MGFSSVRRWAPAISLALGSLLLNACGGGGGGGGGDGLGGGDDGGNGGGDPPPALSGLLWHTNYALDFLDGTQTASPDGAAPARITDELPAWPWADGTQYAVAESNVPDHYTDVTVHATGSGSVLYQERFEGYLRGVKPSPASKQVFLATWGEDSVSDAVYVFFDLSTHTILDHFDTAGTVVHWLPDGRYLRISATGAITTARPGEAAQSAGSVAVPTGRTINGVWVNPQGTQMLMQFLVPMDSGGIAESDLWIAQADGSQLGRLTHTGITNYGKWSPDGQHIGFDVDTGTTCNGGGCSGSCSLWHAPPTARDVVALESSHDAEHFTVKNSHGDERVLGCELLAWTE